MDLFTLIEKNEKAALFKSLSADNINIVNSAHMSLLHFAIIKENNEIARELLKRGIDLDIKDERGQTVLHYLGFHNKYKMAKEILEKAGDVEPKDTFGNTPLWYAVFNARGNYELVIVFLSAGANPNSKNKNNKSPLDFAKQIKDNKLIQLMENQ